MKIFKIRIYALILFIFLFASCVGGTSGVYSKKYNLTKNELSDPTPETVDKLINSLNDKSDRLVKISIKRLGLMQEKATRAIPHLLRIISESNEPSRIECEAMLAIARISPANENVINMLLLKLGSRDPSERIAALKALHLAKYESEEYCNLLHEIGAIDPNRQVRIFARKYYRELRMKQFLKTKNE